MTSVLINVLVPKGGFCVRASASIMLTAAPTPRARHRSRRPSAETQLSSNPSGDADGRTGSSESQPRLLIVGIKQVLLVHPGSWSPEVGSVPAPRLHFLSCPKAGGGDNHHVPAAREHQWVKCSAGHVTRVIIHPHGAFHRHAHAHFISCPSTTDDHDGTAAPSHGCHQHKHQTILFSLVEMFDLHAFAQPVQPFPRWSDSNRK